MLASFASWTSTYLVHPLTGLGYQFWSGIGSDFGEVTLIGGAVLMVRHHNCHVKGCFRPGRHPHGPYKLCARHHPDIPDGPVTVSHIESVDS